MSLRKLSRGCTITVGMAMGSLALTSGSQAQEAMAISSFGGQSTLRVAANSGSSPAAETASSVVAPASSVSTTVAPAASSSAPAPDLGVPAGGASAVEISSSASPAGQLPDAPSPVLRAAYVDFDAMAGGGQNSPVRVAPKYLQVIPAGWSAQHLSAGDKVIVGLHDATDPFSLIGIVLSAGYSHLTNGQPNYGTNSTAFGKRVGAVAARDTSETIFSEAVFAPIFHQDPRYYVMGRGHSFMRRLIYAGTRPIITRTDGGRNTINASELAGYASAAALADTYFPQINRNFHDTVADFGGSIGGAALGDLVSEFYHDFAVAIHLSKP